MLLSRVLEIIHIGYIKWAYISNITMSFKDKLTFSVHKMVEPIKRLLLRKSIMPNEKVTPNQALEWCQNFLGGTWSTITIEQMIMSRIPGGLSNYLYCCSLPDDIETQNNEPRKILLRIYGEMHRQHRSTLLIDSVVCTLLSERKLGPYVYGIFPDGRLEEFVEAQALNVAEIRDENISRKLGGLLGEIHQLNMPLVKEPIWLFYTTERYLSDLPADINKFEIEEDRKIYQELRSVCKFSEEFEALKKILLAVNSPVCFTHNDFQPGNLLRLNSQPDNVTLIDFEYCSYNYRGFDIGNHFCEFMFDYQSATEWPFFKVDFTRYPSEKQQLNFLTSYVDTLIANQDKSIQMMNDLHSNRNDFNRNDLAREIMKEANYFAMASHFFWTLWAINMAKSTAIKFGYMEYARTRLTAYYLLRTMLTDIPIQMPPQFSEELLRSTKKSISTIIYKKTIEKIYRILVFVNFLVLFLNCIPIFFAKL